MNPQKLKMSHAEYHRLYTEFPFLGSSQIKSAKNLAKFKVNVLDGKEEREEKSSFDLGSAAHSLILERDSSRYVVGPRINKNTNEWKAFKSANEGKIVLDEVQHFQLMGMARSASENPKFLDLMSRAIDIESTILWTDDETGLALKARPDGISECDEGLVLWDFKTTRSADKDSFSRSIFDYGYHISMAHYAEAVESVFGERPKRVYIVAQETTTPYLVKIYELKTCLIDGEEMRRSLLNQISVAMKDNKFPSPYGEAIEEIDIPAWARNKAAFDLFGGVA
jgi:exodeoxyribonuclease VIII